MTTPFLEHLAFQLTVAQIKVAAEISRDMAAAHPMQRLLQGDVGSGKTIVAALAALQAIENGFQAAIMAPTEILAEQHFQKLSAWFEPLGIGVAWLSGSQKKKHKQADTATFSAKSASVSDSTVLSAAASTTAGAGNYSISVTQLAKNHTLRSNTNYGATTDTFNRGNLAISIGGGLTVDVPINGLNNTLGGIRQAINDANAGVTATIVNDGTTNRLMLSSSTSGAVGAITDTATDSGSGGTHALAGLDSAALVQTQAADNALLTINGLSISRSSNTISEPTSTISARCWWARQGLSVDGGPDGSRMSPPGR